MLKLTIKPAEGFDNETNKFVPIGEEVIIELEHSLVSVSKWESKYEKTFLTDSQKTSDEIYFYIQCMSNDDISEEVLNRITSSDARIINDYIEQKHSATRFLQRPGSATKSREKITSELIYYWMIALQIPWEAQYWHLERLLTLIEVCQRKNQQASSGSKISRASQARHLRQANAANKARYNTAG